MPEIGPPGLTRRGLETGSRRTYTGTKLETADTAKGSLRGTAPVLDPTFREGDGNVGIIRSPVRAIALPDLQHLPGYVDQPIPSPNPSSAFDPRLPCRRAVLVVGIT